MSLYWDFMRRTVYMSAFIIPIPIGAYTIHNGSSAMVALLSYVVLGLGIPMLYVKSNRSGFGMERNIYIRPWQYALGFFVVQALTYGFFSYAELSLLWGWHTIGRDIAFIAVMYGQVLAALILGDICRRLVS